MKHTILALAGLCWSVCLGAQQLTPLYILYNSSCMDQLEYRYVYAGTTVMGYSVHPTTNEQYILTAGSGGINSPTLPANTVNCREYALNDQFFNDVNNLTRQVYIVHQQTKGYLLTPIIAATQVIRSGSYYLYRAPSYSFAIDTSNLVYESNIATGTSSWYIYFNGLKIRSCFYEYSFMREPTKTNQERSEFDFISGIGISSERTGMTAAEAESNHVRLIKVNGMALEDYINARCQNKTTTAAPPLSKYSPQLTYGPGTIREGDKEQASIKNNPATTAAILPPPLVNCPEMPGEGYHIVQPGETLNGISRAYSISLKSLVGWNGVKDPDKILVCQKIWLKKPPVANKQLAYKGAEENPATYSTGGQPVYRQDMYWQTSPATQPVATYTYAQPQQPVATYNYNQPQQPASTYTPAKQTLVHTVQKGETLYGIGLKYGLSESDIRRINNYPPSGDVVLKPGMQVLVSDCCPQNTQPYQQPNPNPVSTPTNLQPASSQPTYTQPQPTVVQPVNGVLPELFSTPSSTQPTSVSTNPAGTGTPAAVSPSNPQPTSQPAYFQEYIVREGDTINSVAIKFKVNAQELALVNNKEPNETLIAGQRLLIPRN
ncbi:MAG: LysM peptidoglycan-binding domain-containing protein [Saprospiraceae bacterium]|nr:LysM peptidoglycan-binding domain-containing protein [Saprospiraceae bacterium]